MTTYSTGKVGRTYPAEPRVAREHNFFAQFVDRHRIPAAELLDATRLTADGLAELYSGHVDSMDLDPKERNILVLALSTWLGREVTNREVFGQAWQRPQYRRNQIVKRNSGRYEFEVQPQ